MGRDGMNGLTSEVNNTLREKNDALEKRIAELEQENKGLSVALSMPTSVDALTTEAFALEQQAKGVEDFEKLFSFYDSEKDCELVYSEDAISYCAKLRKQAAKIKEQK